MIISASYKTDIPAFYAEWFMKRLEAGFCIVQNPFNGHQKRVPLEGSAIDGFVFWTRNANPFKKALSLISQRRVPFYIQYTIIGYPRSLDVSVQPLEKAISNFRELAVAYGLSALVWRYDPILLTHEVDADWHLKNFSQIATQLAGSTNEVVVSVMHPYAKTIRKLRNANVELGLLDNTSDLLSEMVKEANRNGMKLSICAQPERIVTGSNPAKCIDSIRLSEILGRSFKARMKGQRPGCECDESIDIGGYDTCPHGCVYCYAVNDVEQALRNYKTHNVNALGLNLRQPSVIPPDDLVLL